MDRLYHASRRQSSLRQHRHRLKEEETCTMTQMILTDEQARQIAHFSQPVEVRDSQGRVLGILSPVNAEDAKALVQARQARGAPIPSAKVQDHLRRLDEIRQAETLDEARMLELLRRMQAGEQV
jgi:hypothetical protein